MSYQLNNKAGPQDRLLHAEKLLESRLKTLVAEQHAVLQKMKPGLDLAGRKALLRKKNWEPTLRRVERTHEIPVFRSYKPTVPVVSVYEVTAGGSATPKLGGRITLDVPRGSSDFVSDCAVRIVLGSLKAVSPLDKVRWVELLGHRLCKLTTLKLGANEIDSYTSDDLNAYYQFEMGEDQRSAYHRCIGQENPHMGYVVAEPKVSEQRTYLQIGDGNQTLKNEHAPVELWIPLLFWFRNSRDSFPTFILDGTNMRIEIELSDVNELFGYADYGGLGKITVPSIDQVELHSCHLTVAPVIRDLFASRAGLQMIRVHKRLSKILTTDSGNVALNTAIRWPVEHMCVAFIPEANKGLSYMWHRAKVQTEKMLKQAVVTTGDAIMVNEVSYYSESPTITKLGLHAMDNTIFALTSESFYSSYLPHQYSSRYMNAPADSGWYFLPMCRNPFAHQPSGHFNASQSATLFLQYESQYISPTTPARCVVLARCIQFLVITEGSAVVRYLD